MMLKNSISLIVMLVFSAPLALFAQQSFHDFTVVDINGSEFDLAQLKGKKVLVVNTASKCALTPQYRDLEKLHKEYGGNDFVVIGFPSNDFAGQEPGTNDEIAVFCQTTYEISFPMMSKITVKGDDMHPVYMWLTRQSENGLEDSRVSWNFQKYMIDEDGTLVGHVPPWNKPYNKEIVSWLEKSNEVNE